MSEQTRRSVLSLAGVSAAAIAVPASTRPKTTGPSRTPQSAASSTTYRTRSRTRLQSALAVSRAPILGSGPRTLQSAPQTVVRR